MKRLLCVGGLSLSAVSAACFSAPAGPGPDLGTLHYQVDSGYAVLATADGGSETLTVTLDNSPASCLGGRIVGSSGSQAVKLTLDPSAGRPVSVGTYFIGAAGGPRAAVELVFEPNANVTVTGQIGLTRVSPDVAGHLKAGFDWPDGGSAGTFDFDFETPFCQPR
jgi:hypothetical protein